MVPLLPAPPSLWCTQSSACTIIHTGKGFTQVVHTRAQPNRFAGSLAHISDDFFVNAMLLESILFQFARIIDMM